MLHEKLHNLIRQPSSSVPHQKPTGRQPRNFRELVLRIQPTHKRPRLTPAPAPFEPSARLRPSQLKPHSVIAAPFDGRKPQPSFWKRYISKRQQRRRRTDWISEKRTKLGQLALELWPVTTQRLN